MPKKKKKGLCSMKYQGCVWKNQDVWLYIVVQQSCEFFFFFEWKLSCELSFELTKPTISVLIL